MAAIRKAITAAATVVSELVRDRPLTPQLIDRHRRANERRTALKAELDAIALDVELGDGAAIERHRDLQGQLAKAAAETERLEAALVQARRRDAATAAEADIAVLQDAAQRYQHYIHARLDAIRDLVKFGELARDAARRLVAANELLQSDLPPDCSLPRGLFVGRDIGRDTGLTVDEVKCENANILAHIHGQIERITAAKRGQEAA
jgi:DNA repair exonuclease SbcCD ATPase subunit